jgi:hypothetical protein
MFPRAIAALPRRATSKARPGLLSHLRNHLARLAAARAAQARLQRLTDADCRDTGLSVEDMAGENAWDPALPFFLQRGFDQNGR